MGITRLHFTKHGVYSCVLHHCILLELPKMTKIFPDFCSADMEKGAGICSQSPPVSLELKTVGFCDTR
uniref:Uncharacterized protein n=1 Tax=Cyanistes caeruleus TaxID=156563 RepID=A0A8C0UQH9_CYACU